jgi:hypothetical protein
MTLLESSSPSYKHLMKELTMEGVLDGLWTLFFFGLSQFHGHGSWLICEVTLKLENTRSLTDYA